RNPDRPLADWPSCCVSICRISASNVRYDGESAEGSECPGSGADKGAIESSVSDYEVFTHTAQVRAGNNGCGPGVGRVAGVGGAGEAIDEDRGAPRGGWCRCRGKRCKGRGHEDPS